MNFTPLMLTWTEFTDQTEPAIFKGMPPAHQKNVPRNEQSEKMSMPASCQVYSRIKGRGFFDGAIHAKPDLPAGYDDTLFLHERIPCGTKRPFLIHGEKTHAICP